MKKGIALSMLGSVATVSLVTAPAAAQETAAGTNVTNTASVSYSVGGISQTGTSNTAAFVVDKKVNLTVATTGSVPVPVSVNSTDQVAAFTVTNLTNAVQDFRLTPEQQTLSIPLLGTDNFDVSNMRVFVDSNANGIYEPNLDTATFIDELAPDATITVFVVADIPNNNSASVAILDLRATVAAGGTASSLGADLVATSVLSADSISTVDIVFADDASGINDLARNGQAVAYNAFKIATAVVTMGKTSRVVSDPYNLLINPKAVPGAVVEYCITVNNAGPATISGVDVTDNIPAHTSYVPGSLVVGGTGSGVTCSLLGTVEDDNATGGDETDLYGGSFDGTKITGKLPSVLANLPLTVAFRVTLN